MSGPKGRPSPGRKGVVAGRGPPRVVAAVPVRGAPGRRRGPGGGTRPAFDDNTVWRPNATVNVHQAPSGRIVRTVVPVTGGAVPSAMTTSGPTRVAVFNLAADILEPELKTLFFKFGANKVLVDYDPKTGRSLGSATIYFDRMADAKASVMEYNQRTIDGRPIGVMIAEERGGAGSGGILSRLGDRAGQPQAAGVVGTGSSAGGGRRGRGRGGKRGGWGGGYMEM